MPKQKKQSEKLEKKQPKNDELFQGQADFPIVGIDTSARGLEVLERFFTHLPPDGGMTLVLVSYLAPEYQSIMSSIPQKYTEIPMVEIEEGIQAEPNAVYVIAPDALADISRDISEQNRAERRIKLLQTITQNISEALDFQSALTRTLNCIGEVTNWDYGEAWTLDEEEKVLKCSPVWYGSNENLKQFRAQSESLTFSRNIGLPGRVWVLGEPVWVQEISDNSDSHLARRQLALDAGFNAALAVPFLANHRVVVVLVFFMVEASPEDEQLVDMISTVAAQLGLVLHRKKVQDEREQLLKAVDRQREELRALAGRLAEIQEAERQQLARELHDQMGQNLTALGFNLDAMWARLAETPAGSGAIQSQLDDSLALVEETTDRIRNLMADLRPPVLDEYGLVDALEWYTERFTSRTGLPVEIQNEMLEPRLPNSVETALFRIAQEALTNVAKYAQAKQVTITITEEEHLMRLVLADDGVGFDLVGVVNDKQRQNLGLLTMRERALAVGGRFQIESQPGQGTRVIVEVSR